LAIVSDPVCHTTWSDRRHVKASRRSSSFHSGRNACNRRWRQRCTEQPWILKFSFAARWWL
ncbi:MAG TPA: hypothetical protein VGM98_03570, partial [Schlesneria sp.]